MSAAESNPTSTGSTGSTEMRVCENLECKQTSLLVNVPKRACNQFVTAPGLVEKPILVDGLTSVFQIDGEAAKLCDIKSNRNGGDEAPPPLYRIKPNTHAHITTYIIIDEHSETMRKINEGDPTTLRIILESQRDTAQQKLRKLMTNHATVTANVPVAVVANATKMPQQRTAACSAASSVMVKRKSIPAATFSQALHPNLKITSVSGAKHQPIVSVPMPVITPVPIANLQRLPVQSTKVSIGAGTSAMATPETEHPVELPAIDKMQEEIQELRRTVARLAEAQAHKK